jgi:NADH-quinone oxidoreductase subunit C
MALLADLAARFPQAVFFTSHGQDVVRLERGDLVPFVAAAREIGFDLFIDLCAVDYLTRRPNRFELVVNIVSVGQERRLRILVGIPGDDPLVPSLTGVFAGANFYEREAYDLFGIRFDGHPDLTRILLPDDWRGHPLRKDSPVGSVPVQFKEAP